MKQTPTGEARIQFRGKVIGKGLADSLDGVDDLRSLTLRLQGSEVAKSTKGVLTVLPDEAAAFLLGDDLTITIEAVQGRLKLEGRAEDRSQLEVEARR
jgi:hypothetical protein